MVRTFAAHDADVIQALAGCFGTKISLVDHPGGKDRKTALYRIGSRTCAVSVRKSEARARLEAEILLRLGPLGLSPRLVARVGRIVVQEAIPGNRLPAALHAEVCEDDLLRGIETLVAAQVAGNRAGLAGLVPAIGTRAGWEAELALAPVRLGQKLGLYVPEHDFGNRLSATPDERSFIKWDARPGNAIKRPDGSVCWIDWEHAGNRRPVDDLAWFLADEWSPDRPRILGACLDRLSLAHGQSAERMRQQFLAMAIAHSCIRLSLILDRKGTGTWWDYGSCLRHDRVGVTRRHVSRLTTRAASWATEAEGLVRLNAFFNQVEMLIIET